MINYSSYLRKNKDFIIYLIKFLSIFFGLYLVTDIIIALSAPEGYYNEIISSYFDYISWLKKSLLYGAGIMAHLFGYTTLLEPNFLIRVINGKGVIIAMSCVGYGVMSFWCAYILVSKNSKIILLLWLVGGLFLLWFINACRIGLFLVSINKGWNMPLGLNHHTWFNIFAYGAILIMIIIHENSIKNK